MNQRGEAWDRGSAVERRREHRAAPTRDLRRGAGAPGAIRAAAGRAHDISGRADARQAPRIPGRAHRRTPRPLPAAHAAGSERFVDAHQRARARAGIRLADADLRRESADTKLEVQRPALAKLSALLPQQREATPALPDLLHLS